MPQNTLAEKQPPVTWAPPGADLVAFPFTSFEYRGGNRIVKHERLYRDGARHDDTGGEPDTFIFHVHFFNNVKKAGVKGDQLYPDERNRLIAALKIHEVGNLTIPSMGTVRARAKDWTASENGEAVDQSLMTITFVGDNEEDVTAASFTAISAKSLVVPKTKDVVQQLQRQGVWSNDVKSLEQLAGQIENLASAPGDYARDLKERGERLTSALDRITYQFPATIGILAPPGTIQTRGAITALRDIVARASNPNATQSSTRVLMFAREMSVMSIAALSRHAVGDILALNPGIPNHSRIAPYTPVLVPRNGTPIFVTGAL